MLISAEPLSVEDSTERLAGLSIDNALQDSELYDAGSMYRTIMYFKPSMPFTRRD